MKTEGKQCRVCGVALAVGENWQASRARKWDHICTPCKAAQSRKYYQENREQSAARKRKYRQENPERIAAWNQKHYRENREQIADRKRKYHQENREQALARAWKRYQTPEGRARRLLNGAQRRAKKRGEAFLLTPERVLLALEKGVCERTGLAFMLDRKWGSESGRWMNPRAPSLDRIDPNGPYSDENVQVVIWQYNLAKGELPENEFLQFCRRVVRTADKKVAK